MRPSGGSLARKSFGVVILDEAHKARASRGQQGRDDAEAEQPSTIPAQGRARRHERDPRHCDADPARRRGTVGSAVRAWVRARRKCWGSRSMAASGCARSSIRFLTGDRPWPTNETNRWGLFRNPLPPAVEHSVFRDIRNDAGLATSDVLGPRFDASEPRHTHRLPERLSRPSPSATTRSSGASCGGHGRCSRSVAY